ncbi:lateral signaling target protein 2 homolog [Elysia marginata]|uniref:Lateral signaling target protein 2 homolog n=1 Tax=Elysia marginata TaxID=1093978 RepID=A0AAV4HJJ0_9GAST|nr:lateral signaling target protein 2 homolog [Elysia marginata]
MAIVFWDAKGVILLDILPQGQFINAVQYCSPFDRLKDAIRCKNPRHLKRAFVLQHDNMTPQSANCITEAEGGELSSLGTVSNAASDASWEAIDDSEEKIVMWVPDSLVTHCAGCDGQFWMAKRKHHCRNCGKVFCWECSNFLAPVPHQHLNKPQRVCSRCHSSLLQLSPGASSDGRIPTLVADG